MRLASESSAYWTFRRPSLQAFAISRPLAATHDGVRSWRRESSRRTRSSASLRVGARSARTAAQLPITSSPESSGWPGWSGCVCALVSALTSSPECRAARRPLSLCPDVATGYGDTITLTPLRSLWLFDRGGRKFAGVFRLNSSDFFLVWAFYASDKVSLSRADCVNRVFQIRANLRGFLATQPVVWRWKARFCWPQVTCVLCLDLATVGLIVWGKAAFGACRRGLVGLGGWTGFGGPAGGAAPVLRLAPGAGGGSWLAALGLF